MRLVANIALFALGVGTAVAETTHTRVITPVAGLGIIDECGGESITFQSGQVTENFQTTVVGDHFTVVQTTRLNGTATGDASATQYVSRGSTTEVVNGTLSNGQAEYIHNETFVLVSKGSAPNTVVRLQEFQTIDSDGSVHTRERLFFKCTG